MKHKWMIWTAVGLGLLLASAESTVRLMGLTDFPVYNADSEQGYIPAPGQSGAFLNHNRWYFNEKSMGTDRPFAQTGRDDVLLVGDSIVLGGNTMDQSVKLGPVLSALEGRMHWPISAGSWALLNEIHYLKKHPEVLSQVSEIEFVLNSADFGQASSWACETTHPREHPVVALVYLLEKYVIKTEPCGTTPNELEVRPADWRIRLLEVMNLPAVRGKPVTFWLYPTHDEARNAQLLQTQLEAHAQPLLQATAGLPVKIYSLARHSKWRDVQYTDAIHPTVDGIRTMAQIMTSAERASMQIPAPPVE